jgi:hypothetical protein
VGAALTTTGRAGTARRLGSGKQGGKVHERNQRQSPSSENRRLQPGGYGPERSARLLRWATLKPVCIHRREGHEESLRRTRGEAAGTQLSADPHRSVRDERGNRSGVPTPPASQAGGGKVRRRLTAPEWNGAPVVVRGRECRLHGEGGQRVPSNGTEDQEDAGEHRRTVARP